MTLTLSKHVKNLPIENDLVFPTIFCNVQFSAFSEFGNKSEKSQRWFPQDLVGIFKCSAFLICASNRCETEFELL